MRCCVSVWTTPVPNFRNRSICNFPGVGHLIPLRCGTSHRLETKRVPVEYSHDLRGNNWIAPRSICTALYIFCLEAAGHVMYFLVPSLLLTLCWKRFPHFVNNVSINGFMFKYNIHTDGIP
jgi:hypothetical protein